MAFRGDLANINFASVLQNLLDNEQTGMLRLRDEEREAFLYFRRGRMTMYTSGREARTPIAEYLSRSGGATAKQIASARKRLRGRRNLSAVLGRMGVEPERIREAVRRFVEEEVCELFTWQSGQFEFTEGAPPAGVFDSDMATAKLDIDPNGLILEAARRADAWDHINRHIRSQNEIFVLRREAASALEETFEPEVVEVAGLLDGRRDVAELVKDAGLGRFPVLRALSHLLAQGAARAISITEVMGLAEAALAKREFEEAARFYRRALEIERNNLECRRGLIEALEGAGDRAEASAERKLLAATLQHMGDVEEAGEQLRRAIEAAPTDITAREKYVSLLQETGAAGLAEAASLDLGKAYLSLGIAGKARWAFAHVLKGRPHDPARVARMLADACIKAGDVPAAVEAYRKAGDCHIAAEEYGAASEVCEEILRLQPDNLEAQKRLEEIHSGRMLRRKRQRRRLKYRLVLEVLAILGAGWFVYDWLGAGFLEDLSIAATAHAERGEFEDALRCYEAVREHCPLTRAAASAARFREALAERAAVSLLGEGKRLERLGLTKEALERYRRAEAMRPPPGTLRLLRAARERLEKRSARALPEAGAGAGRVPSGASEPPAGDPRPPDARPAPPQDAPVEPGARSGGS